MSVAAAISSVINVIFLAFQFQLATGIRLLEPGVAQNLSRVSAVLDYCSMVAFFIGSILIYRSLVPRNESRHLGAERQSVNRETSK